MSGAQGFITLATAGVATTLFWLAAMGKTRPLKFNDVLMFALMAGAAVTGGFVVWGAVKTMDTAPDTAVWGGLMGLVMSLMSLQKLFYMTRAVIAGTEIPPTEPHEP